MIRKTDWQPVQDELHAEQRARLGEPPTPETLLAFTNGELPPDEEARVRELLVCYPDLARALAASAPAEPQPGDPDYVSDEELSRRWASLQSRVHATAPHRAGGQLLFWRAATALAATLALVFGALLWQERQPQVDIEEAWLDAAGPRGTSNEIPTFTNETKLVLIGTFTTHERFPRYRGEIFKDEGTMIWSSNSVRRHPEYNTAVVELPDGYLEPGTYRLDLYGISGKRKELVGSYEFRIERR